MPTQPEKRAQKRERVTAIVEYSCLTPEGGISIYESSTGITINLSGEGMGFYTTTPLRPGVELKVLSRRMSRRPTRAHVRWCKRLSVSLYRIGVEFS